MYEKSNEAKNSTFFSPAFINSVFILLLVSFHGLALPPVALAGRGPAAPTNLAATAASSEKILLSWYDNAPREAGFTIERSFTSSGTYTVIATVGANVASFSDTKLTQKTSYYYRVRAFKRKAFSAYSNDAIATTQELAAPSGLNATPMASGQMTISWVDNTSNETRYDIERSTSQKGPFGVIGYTAADTHTFEDKDLALNTSYDYRVRGFDGTNYSAYAYTAARPLVSIQNPVPGITGNRTPLLSYDASEGTVIVTVDGVPVDKLSGTTLDPLADGSHTVRVEATDSANNTGFAQVVFTVDTTAPVVAISSPSAGATNEKTPVLTYTTSDGKVVVTVDGTVVGKVSGDALDALADGIHVLRVEATDAANNVGYAEVAFSVVTPFVGSNGTDDGNPYCDGTSRYLVGPGGFTNGIRVPAQGTNDVLIASPTSWSTVNGPRTIVKGAMDTTVPLRSITVQVSSASGTAVYQAQINGNYFAASVPVEEGDITITVTATDQNNIKHQSSVAVIGLPKPDNITLTASPNTGITTLKQEGSSFLDVLLAPTVSLSNPVSSYAWDFGTGAIGLICKSHSTVTAGFGEAGLYLTSVVVTDTAGRLYKETAIVNVLDKETMNYAFNQTWNSMKTALTSGDIEGAVSHFAEVSKSSFKQRFTAIAPSLKQLVANMGSLNLVEISDTIAQGDLRYVKDGMEYSFQVLYIRDENGNWGILGF